MRRKSAGKRTIAFLTWPWRRGDGEEQNVALPRSIDRSLIVLRNTRRDPADVTDGCETRSTSTVRTRFHDVLCHKILIALLRHRAVANSWRLRA